MNITPRIIRCAKLKKEAVGVSEPPYEGPLGERIYASISQEAWELWLNHQTLLINEGRLNLRDAQVQEDLQAKMTQFLFSEESVQRPAGYVPPEDDISSL